VRLGGCAGYFPPATVSVCVMLLMDIQPAHLQHHSARKLSPDERDSIRAKIIREKLQNLPTPASNPTSPTCPEKPEDDTPATDPL